MRVINNPSSWASHLSKWYTDRPVMTTRERFAYACLTAAWMAVIFYFSSVPNLKSPLPTFADFILRKPAHMAEYAVLYILLWKTLQGVRYRTWIAFSITVFYAMTDETHQLFISGRVGSPVDVGIDIVGAFIGSGATKKIFSS